MINSAVFDLMMKRLGNRQAAPLRATCVTELNQAIKELERSTTKPWFLENSEEDVTVANTSYVDLPSDFLMETEEGTFELQHPSEGWVELLKVTREKARLEAKNALPAFPEAYYLWGNRIYFAPTPDIAYNYRFDYYSRTSVLADNSSEVTNSWITEFFDLTTYKAMIIIARDHIQSDRMTTNFMSSFNLAQDKFFREVEARKVANMTLLLTDEEN